MDENGMKMVGLFDEMLWVMLILHSLLLDPAACFGSHTYMKPTNNIDLIILTLLSESCN